MGRGAPEVAQQVWAAAGDPESANFGSVSEKCRSTDSPDPRWRGTGLLRGMREFVLGLREVAN